MYLHAENCAWFFIVFSWLSQRISPKFSKICYFMYTLITQNMTTVCDYCQLYLSRTVHLKLCTKFALVKYASVISRMGDKVKTWVNKVKQTQRRGAFMYISTMFAWESQWFLLFVLSYNLSNTLIRNSLKAHRPSWSLKICDNQSEALLWDSLVPIMVNTTFKYMKMGIRAPWCANKPSSTLA